MAASVCFANLRLPEESANSVRVAAQQEFRVSSRALSISVSFAILALAASPFARALQNPSGSPPASNSAPPSSPQDTSGPQPAAAPNSSEPDPALLRDAEQRFDEEARAAEAKLNPNQKQAQQSAAQPDLQPPSPSSGPAAKPGDPHPAAKGDRFGVVLNPPLHSGIPVRDVHPGTPAEKAGLKSGDVIARLDGRQIRSVSDLCDRLNDSGRAKSVRLGIIRGKARLSILLPPENSKLLGSSAPGSRD